MQAIPAFEEAVAGMKVGGVRRVEISGDRPELGWDRNAATRCHTSHADCAHTDFGTGGAAAVSHLGNNGGCDVWHRYSKGPRPKDFDGERALDFVLGKLKLVLAGKTTW